MLFWHLGASVWLFRWIFRDPKVDVRFLLVGAVFADLIDMPIGTLILRERYASGELWAHSLIIPAIFMALVLLMTRRGRKRRAWMALGVGWLLHLVLDAMWLNEQTFLWPFFGWEIEAGEMPFWPMAWDRALSDPWRWVTEVVGIAYLVWLWITLGLGVRNRRRDVYKTGRLPVHVSVD